MWPSKADPAYGSFVKDLAKSIENIDGVKFSIAAISSNKKGIIVPIKYLGLSIKSLFLAIAKQPDLIYCHYLFPTGYIGWMAKKVIRKPLVITCHGSDVYVADKSPWLKKLVNKTVDSADRIITVSSYLAGQLSGRFSGISGKLDIVNCGVDQALFNPAGAERERQETPIIILFVGALNENKNALGLIRAAADLQLDFRLQLVGSGPLKEELVKVATEMGISDKVDFVGAVSKSKLPEYYRGADILVMPSLKEAFGLVALEAMACGLPVAVSNREGLAELIQDGVDGLLFDPENEEDVRDAILRLAGDGKAREALAIKAMEKAGENSIDNQATKIKKIFQKLTETG